MSPKSVLITGCNRGIGLELVRAFTSRAECQLIIATCRDKSKATDLVALAAAASPPGRIVILELDITDMEAYPAFVERIGDLVGDAGLNLLINNAGLLPANALFHQVTPEDMRRAFEVNCVAPLFLARSILPIIRRAAKNGSSLPVSVSRAGVVFISTSVASIAENGSGGRTGGYAYRCSKSALNQAMKSMAVDLAAEDSGLLILSLHPGWVKTDMGGPNALITADTSAKTMVETLEKLGADDHGSFRRYDNSVIPW